MLLNLDIETKTIGAKELFHALHLALEPNQKIAVIGRNGVGKTTLFQILVGKDTDYTGSLQLKRGTRLISTVQEHHALGQQSAVEYILHNLPEYRQLKHIIDTYPDTMGESVKKIQTYSEALERFSNLGYYQAEESIIRSLGSYQISETMAQNPMAYLSGGQKRLVELVRIEHADADIVLIDEPTNHMDYAAKHDFIEWLQTTQQTTVVVTHDRDVLQHVDAVIELKDGSAYTFKGNYAAYLTQNVTATRGQLNDYQAALRTLETLHKKILWARARKPSWHGTADQRNPFEVMERRLQKEYDAVKQANPRPSFWIDRESAEGLTKQVSDSYEKFKTKNIRIQNMPANSRNRELISIDDLSLGYQGRPLFAPIQFRLQSGERLRVVGRNGVGKTTLVNAILAASKQMDVPTLLQGTIACATRLRVSVYEQEVQATLLDLPLSTAIEYIYDDAGLPVTDQMIKGLMSDYLFDPYQDGQLRVEQLSGGQKARLQIIRLLARKPELLILDEPTNHLDLPSIEELEEALAGYPGAILYITHDSYFAKRLGGAELVLEPTL